MRALLLVLTFVFLGAACRKSVVLMPKPAPLAAPAGSLPFTPGGFITTAGVHAHARRDELAILDLKVSGKRMDWIYSLERRIPGGGHSRRHTQAGLDLRDPGDPWFVYAETPGRFWFFNGSEDLYYTLGDDSGSMSGQAIFQGKLQNAAPPIPDEVVVKLPPDLRKQLPPVEDTGSRPSI